jgi:cobalt-zinc-cadmium resistance protein CzcA
VIGALLALLAAGGAFLLLGKSFMPTMDEGDLIMQLEKLPSIGLDQTIAIDSACSRPSWPGAGGESHRRPRRSDELGLDPMGLNQTDTFLVLSRATPGASPTGLAGRPVARRDGRFPRHRLPSPSPSTCAFPKC